MQPEENQASDAGNETSAVSAGNASTASHAGMDPNAGWNMLTSFMNRMKEKEQNGTWTSYRNTDTGDVDDEEEGE
ncbi:hypothetical protein [Actinotignum sp. GS-2025c]|uniref:hypothetical protein n=1 Tax=Actinotignum sp. GS-2025c TaxID=3427276 RepID=UPI003F45FA1C